MKNTAHKLLGSALLLTLATGGVADAAIQVTLNGQPLATSVPPLQIKGSTLVPMRDIFEALGARLTWNPSSQTIFAQKDLTTIQLAINNPTALVNGRPVPLSQPATLVDGKTFVPLRFVSEAMSAQVEWNSALQLVSIRTQPLVATYPLPTPVNPVNDPNSPSYIPPFQAPVNPGTGTEVAEYRNILVPARAVVPVQFDRAISSATARVGETVTASIVSRRLGDSEFPIGTKLEAVVVEAAPRTGKEPGVLDFDFRTAILPNGDRVPLSGELTALDSTQVVSENGRVVAKGGSSSDKLKVVGIGAGAGFILGKVLKTNSTLTAILGAAGGYLVGKSQDKQSSEATVPVNAKLGVLLREPVRYADRGNYWTERSSYLRNLEGRTTEFDGAYYGVDSRVAGPRRGDRLARFEGYDSYDNEPLNLGNVLPNQPTGPNRPTPVNADYADVIVPARVVVPVRFDGVVTSANARVGDRVTATVVSKVAGDSEFPVGTKLEAIITEATRRNGREPGVLDMEFRSATLPSGVRVPLSGMLTALDSSQVASQNGRVVAKAGTSTDKLKVVGIGAGAGFVLGRVLKTNSTVTTILGAAGGYLVGRGQDSKGAEAIIQPATTVGVQMLETVRYSVLNPYSTNRSNYLRGLEGRTSEFDGNYYGVDSRVAGPRRGDRTTRYDGFDTFDNQPVFNPTSGIDEGTRIGGYQRITLPEGVVIPVTLDVQLSSSNAKAGDTFFATVETKNAGDSEFPGGTRIEGRVVSSTPKEGNDPGQLELEFTHANLPGGRRVRLDGDLISLDTKSTTVSEGRITAKAGGGGDKLKVIGIGAAAGFVVGRLLKKDGVLPALLGALGGYLYGNSQNDKPAEAVVPAGARIGVRLNRSVTYTDADYYQYRARYNPPTS